MKVFVFLQATKKFNLDPVACAYIADYISFGDSTTKYYVFAPSRQTKNNRSIQPVVASQPANLAYIQQQLQIESKTITPPSKSSTPMLPVTPATPVTPTQPTTALSKAQAQITSMLTPLVFYEASNVFIPAQNNKTTVNITDIANNLNTYIQNNLYKTHTNTYALLWGTSTTPSTITFALPTTTNSTQNLTLPEIVDALSSTNAQVQLICQTFSLDSTKQIATPITQNGTAASSIEEIYTQLETTTAQGTADANFTLQSTFLVQNSKNPKGAPIELSYQSILGMLYNTQFNISCTQEQIEFPTSSNIIINSTDGQIDDADQAQILDHVLQGLQDLQITKILLQNGRTVSVKTATNLLNPFIQDAEQAAPPAPPATNED